MNLAIDARGLKCPLPVIRLEKALDGIRPGESVVITCTDPVARVDIPLLCRKAGHACEIAVQGEALEFTVTKTT